jgi:hypothetical protein
MNQNKGWKIEHTPFNDYQGLCNQYFFEIGGITDTIGVNIKEMLEHHPPDWISAAISYAVSKKKKSWGFIKDTIANWDINGKPNSIKPTPAFEDREELAEPQKAQEAPVAVKAELKESIKEGKQINKEAVTVVKKAEKIFEAPKQKESVKAAISQTKNMDYQDRATYLEVVDRRIEEIDRMAGEMSQEGGSIKEFIESDPVANYRGKKYGQKVGLIYLLDKYGKFPDSVTKKQADLILMGRGLKPAAVNAKGRVPWEYVIDELADHFKRGIIYLTSQDICAIL